MPDLIANLLGCSLGQVLARRFVDRPLVHDGMQWWTPCRLRERRPAGGWTRRRYGRLRMDGRDALWRVGRSAPVRLPAEGAVATREGEAVRISWPDGRAVEAILPPKALADLYAAFGPAA